MGKNKSNLKYDKKKYFGLLTEGSEYHTGLAKNLLIGKKDLATSLTINEIVYSYFCFKDYLDIDNTFLEIKYLGDLLMDKIMTPPKARNLEAVLFFFEKEYKKFKERDIRNLKKENMKDYFERERKENKRPREDSNLRPLD